jgi:hypothetical protein
MLIIFIALQKFTHDRYIFWKNVVHFVKIIRINKNVDYIHSYTHNMSQTGFWFSNLLYLLIKTVICEGYKKGGGYSS